MKESTSFQSFFNTTVVDNNGKSITDIHAGLENLTAPLRDADISPTQLYLTAEYEEGYPDVVANNSNLGSYSYWFWLLLINGLTDPLTQIKREWVYSITDSNQIDNFVSEINSNVSTSEQDRIGETVELN